MASKLGIPFTNDLLALGSNSAISDALIEKAVALGKSEAQINAAMATLWLTYDWLTIFKLTSNSLPLTLFLI